MVNEIKFKRGRAYELVLANREESLNIVFERVSKYPLTDLYHFIYNRDSNPASLLKRISIDGRALLLGGNKIIEISRAGYFSIEKEITNSEVSPRLLKPLREAQK